MTKATIAALVTLALVGCSRPLEGPKEVVHVVPLSILPTTAGDIEGAKLFLDWVSYVQLVPAGDDDMPDKVCTQMGPPNCINAYGDLWWCQNACGDAYWHLTYTNTCIDVRTGEVFECP